MSDKQPKPSWYPLNVYNKQLTPEEWLHELYKRSVFNDILSNPFLSQQQKILIFDSIILKNEIDGINSKLKSQLVEPIRDLSITELFCLLETIKQNCTEIEISKLMTLESAVKAKLKGVHLTQEQQHIFSDYHDKSWYSFIPESENKHSYPKIPYLLGAPVTINAYFRRDDIIMQLSNLLNQWRHKRKLPEISNKVFSTWTEKNILAIFDLQAWYKINNIEICKIELARLIWPKPPISKKKKSTTVYLDDYLDDAIKLSKQNIHFGNVSMLMQTCETRKYFQDRKNRLKNKNNQ